MTVLGDAHVQIHVAHVLDGLAALPEASCQMAVCSPPYWNLREYGTTPQLWGGDPACDHQWETGQLTQRSGGTKSPKVGIKGQANFQIVPAREYDTCSRCGCWRGELGGEPTPALFVEHLVLVFRAVKRVLKPTGTLWLNLANCYNSSPPGNSKPMSKSGLNGAQTSASYRARLEDTQQAQQALAPDLKPKDLVGIAWMTALALQADRWYLRSAIIWQKPSVMPESITDRPSKSYEYIFLLSVKDRYYYDAAAIAEPVSQASLARLNQPSISTQAGSSRAHAGGKTNGRMKAVGGTETRNARDVWTFSGTGTPGDHYAAYPEELPRRCIKAGSAPGDVVLDPFGGSGTTAVAARRLRRDAVLIELNPAYAQAAWDRVKPVSQYIAQREASSATEQEA